MPFLTAEWSNVLWLIDLSLAAAIVANAIYLWYEAAWFKAIGDAALAGLTLVVAVQVLRVFPFDFTGYDFPATTARMVLVCIVVGSAIAVLVKLIQLTRPRVGGVWSDPASGKTFGQSGGHARPAATGVCSLTVRHVKARRLNVGRHDHRLTALPSPGLIVPARRHFPRDPRPPSRYSLVDRG